MNATIKNHLKSIVLGLLLIVMTTHSSVLKAQDAAATGAASTSTMKGLEPRAAVGNILMAGLVGGILGLSTLSFYDRPQDNIRNITLGAGIGMIAVALYMTYNVTESVKGSAKKVAIFEPKPQSSQWALIPNYDLQKNTAQAQFLLNF